MKKILFCIYLLAVSCALFAQHPASAKRDSARYQVNFLLETLKKYETGNDKRKIPECRIALGGIYFEQGNYLEALDSELKALKLAEQSGNTALMSKCYNMIGSVFLVQKDYSKAKDYFLRALNISQKTGEKNEMAKALNNIGNAYEAGGKYSEALPYYFKSLKLYEELGSKAGIAICSSNLGIVYSASGDDPTAAAYHFKALALDEEIGSKAGIACDALHIGSFYIKTKKYPEAENYLLRSLALSDSLEDLLGQKEASEHLSRVYSSSGNHQKALAFYQRAMLAKDSLFNEEKNKELTRLEMSFEFEKKEATAKAAQEKKNLRAEADLRRNKFIAGSLIILLGLLLTAIVLAFQKQQLGRKKDKIIFERETELLRSEQERLHSELEHSKKMLDTYTESMLRKSELLEKFNAEIETLKQLKSKELYEEKIGQLDYLNKITILTDEDWLKFQELFEQVYTGFFVRLKEKLPGLTPAETRLMCLTKLKLTSKQMADVLGVSLDTIKKTRYRLRKKLVDPELEDIADLVKNI